MNWFLIGILVFFAVNIALTLAFRYWDLHWYIDDLTERVKGWFGK